MEEQEIRDRLPGIHSILLGKHLDQSIWQQIHADFSDLQWLQVPDLTNDTLVPGILSICNRAGKNFLTQQPYFYLAELSRVNLFIHNSLNTLTLHKEKSKETLLQVKKLLNDLKFFKKSKSILDCSSAENFLNAVLAIEQAYKQLKHFILGMLLQIDKSLQIEFDKNTGDLLNEIFYTEVLYPHKARIKEVSDRIIQDYKVSSYYTNTKFSGGYFTSFPKAESIYIGEVNERNKKEGFGKMFFTNRDTYEGMWKNDKPEGNGLYLWKDGGKYLGDFKDGSMEGFGKRLYYSGGFYEGEFVGGKRNGKGKMMFKNGDCYEGEWFDEDMQGKGMYKWASGDFYVGEFKRDKREGKGVLTLTSGEVYADEWENGSIKKENNTN